MVSDLVEVGGIVVDERGSGIIASATVIDRRGPDKTVGFRHASIDSPEA